MNDLLSTVDWSRAQFALTAMYHWLFVPLTIGLSVIIAVMETIYVRTGKNAWKGITKFWMTLFGINFACGVATGLILEFEFGTNWSNYSWFVGDIFGAPLAIEGLFAFFMEATFVAVMFFGWKKVSPKMHLTATWLTAVGVTLSALWILVANAWMQYPVGMEFNPESMRNEMSDFAAVALSPVAVNKFLHAVFSAWALAGIFVIGVSSWFLFRKKNIEASVRSIKVAGWIGGIGLLLTFFTGHGSAVEVSRTQPMKLAAMEGLHRGEINQGLVVFGIYDEAAVKNGADAIRYKIEVPGMLSIMANGQANTFVPGIDDIIDGYTLTPEGDTVNTISYAERIKIGTKARIALAQYEEALKTGDNNTQHAASNTVKDNFEYFGYGFLENPSQAIPPVAITFYAFRIMVLVGGLLMLVYLFIMWAAYRRPNILERRWVAVCGMLSVAMVWICSQAGWVVAEVGRQPWVVQDKMPTGVAISDIPASSVQVTFWIFAALFTALLIAEISIMIRQIVSASNRNIQKEK